MKPLRFETPLLSIKDWTILLLPKNESMKLPSRGPIMVEGSVQNYPIRAVMEPDGRGSHWLRLKEKSLAPGTKVVVDLAVSNDWISPEVPKDFQNALIKHPKAYDLWGKITPNAQWEWVRWIRATKQPETRTRRIEVACSKLNRGTRRPCCFNRNMCTEPLVSEQGVLIDPR